MALRVDQPAKEFLIDKGYNPDFGARPLRRAIEQYVEDPLSDGILREEFGENQIITVTREEGKDHLKFSAEALPDEVVEAAGNDEPVAAMIDADAGLGAEEPGEDAGSQDAAEESA